MKINKIVFLAGIFACAVARADTPDFMDMQIAELTARRDALRAEIAECEENTQKYKVAGVATLAATGVGVVGNIALHNKIQAATGGARSGSGGGAKRVIRDTRSEEQKADIECTDKCKRDATKAAKYGCEC